MRRRRRKKGGGILVIGQFVILFGILATFASPSKQEPVVHVVEMVKMKFIPDSITIKLGDSIKFVNKSKYLHNIVAKKLGIKTKYIKKNKSLTVKPSKIGKYKYYCAPHRSMGMKGTITIKE